MGRNAPAGDPVRGLPGRRRQHIHPRRDAQSVLRRGGTGFDARHEIRLHDRADRRAGHRQEHAAAQNGPPLVLGQPENVRGQRSLRAGAGRVDRRSGRAGSHEPQRSGPRKAVSFSERGHLSRALRPAHRYIPAPVRILRHQQQQRIPARRYREPALLARRRGHTPSDKIHLGGPRQRSGPVVGRGRAALAFGRAPVHL